MIGSTLDLTHRATYLTAHKIIGASVEATGRMRTAEQLYEEA